ncbi:tyrosine-type recombinase/integrase [Laspinema olomoucense]|uniref:tyrosine-type recombinase/integrase n=1 Tax=Laspinema olomoucense TaxID=3231600 RepID=UPI0021BB03A2|nr:site-specific integrase [Laspinema sp. D3a]MCT7992004.1 site-specific integrase [Laspinema sp. D3a]
MVLRLESAEHPHPLALLEPLPLTRHPAAVYLSQLAETSRRTMGHNLNWCARVLSAGQCDRLTLDWAKLRYEHTAALRSILLETHPPSTGNLKLTAVKQVLKAARKLRLMDADDYEDAVSIDRISGDAPLRGRLLQPDEIQALVRVCQESNTAIGTRDAAAVACFCAGLRRAEVVALDYRDCDWETRGLLVRQGKGKKYRQTYLRPGSLELLENWVSLRGRRSGPLFYHCQWWGEIVPERITSDAIALRLQEWGKVAGLDPFSAHDFRRTFISNLLDKGVDIATVQQLAGHSNIETTARYDRRGEETKRAAVQKLGL